MKNPLAAMRSVPFWTALPYLFFQISLLLNGSKIKCVSLVFNSTTWQRLKNSLNICYLPLKIHQLFFF